MKKSMLYKIAQMSVVRDNILDDSSKLEVIRVLQEREEFEIYREKEAEKKEGDSNEENRK